MSASTCPAGVPGEAIADVVRDGAAGLDGTDAVGVGRAAGRFPGMDDRLAEAAGGTLAATAWKGLPAHDPDTAEPPDPEPADIEPPDAEPQVVGVGKAVTFPDAGGAGLEPLVR